MVVLTTTYSQSNSVSVHHNQTVSAESMAHWMHCNGCYCQPQPGVDLKFYLTNCSHLYCEKCVASCAKERCKVCRSQCTTLMLGGKLPKEVENLFSDPIDMHQKFNKQFHQTLEFQKSHQRRLVRQLKEKMKLFGQQFSQFIEQANAMKGELKTTKAENEYLRMMLKKKKWNISCPILW
ncbi:unnamed protein product [Lymnaea stagnalis]|uniref:RING-type domain-containing protein n=1 Tax=Lymnaea stagnalis TaxID=6523 RepID=A0AAV2I5G5_LYMST